MEVHNGNSSRLKDAINLHKIQQTAATLAFTAAEIPAPLPHLLSLVAFIPRCSELKA